jgi:signal recognition particle GTPase
VSCGLRDVLEFERDGKPAVLVASDVFTAAADKQARMLGQPAARRAFVPHPVQDRTDDELRGLAQSVVDELIAELQRA